ncbi:MAG: nicotinate-nicotinamide nucleotide adenylyltransferase [Myxococcota bacterium]
MRIAVYGGSFNPPHRAHAMVARWVIESNIADEVWLVPVFHHAFEGSQDKALAPYDLRLSWCRVLADEIGQCIKVSDVESKLSVPSYSIDTLNFLSVAHPEHQFFLVVGADILTQVDGWKDWDKIQKDHSPVVVGRPGYPAPGDTPMFPDISSTVVRKTIADGGDLSELLSPSVAAEIMRENPWVD